MAKKYHPDSVATSGVSNQVKNEAEVKFKQINEAYDVLGKSDKKIVYDEMRRAERMFNSRSGSQAD